ncbi:MAG: DUF3592 domain-containing protein [Verrucomicrobiota bacterium]
MKSKSKAPGQLAGGCLSLFGLPFFVAGLFLSGLYFRGYSEWWQAQGWKEVPCWIDSTELKASRGDDSTTYQALATYRYEYGGKEYRGDRVTFGKGSDNIGKFHHRAHRELSTHVVQKGKTAEAVGSEGDREPFRCYVNPSKPDEAVLYRELRWQMQAFMAVFALTFPAVGAGLVAGGFLTARAAKRDLALKDKHPDVPWKWKAIWAGPSIRESAGEWKSALHLYTFWSGLVIVPLIVTTAMTGAFQTEPMAWLLLIFVALWCLPLWASLKRFRQRLAIGSPRLELTELPAYPGGVLAGAVVLGKPLPPRGDAELSLVCEKKTTRSDGDGDSTSTEKIWSHSENMPLDRITRDDSGYRLPVEFSLPADAPQSEAGADPAVKHVWKLRLKVPGTVICPEFEVPVFRTEKSPVVTAAVPSIHEIAFGDLPGLLAERGIKADFDSNGFPRSIVCPAARHRLMIVFLLVFNLIWTGAAVFLICANAPLIFRVVWPVSAAGIWLVILYQLLHSRKVAFSSTGLEIANRIGPWNRTADFEKSGLTGFSHDTNMTSGNTVFYRVRCEDVFGKKTTLADGITGSATAAALASRLEDWRRSEN